MKIQLSKKTSNGTVYLTSLLLGFSAFLLLPSIALIPVLLLGMNSNEEVLSIVNNYLNTGVITNEFYYLNVVADFIGKSALMVLLFVIFKNSFKYDLKEFGEKWKTYLPLIAISAVAMYFGNILVNLIYMLFGETGVSDNQELINGCLTGDIRYFMVIETILVAPIVEEMIFRKFMIGTFEEKFGWKPMVAVVISTIVFSLIHVIGGDAANYLYIFQYIPLAFVISYSYYKSDYNIFVPIIIHFINNALAVIMFYVTL